MATAFTPKPKFRDDKGWKLTPGGTGLYSMSTPRRLVTTVAQRPTTTLYGDRAKEAYFKKYPGAPSPLLQELWVQRDEYNFRGDPSAAPPLLSPPPPWPSPEPLGHVGIHPRAYAFQSRAPTGGEVLVRHARLSPEGEGR